MSKVAAGELHATLADSAWLDARALATREGVTPRGIQFRLDQALASANGTRSKYERRVPSTRGGGSGFLRQWNALAIQRDLPGVLRGEYSAPTPETHDVHVGTESLALRPAAHASAPVALTGTTGSALNASPQDGAPAQQTLSLFTPPPDEQLGARALTPAEHDQALERWQVIKPLRDFDQLTAAEQAAGVTLRGRRFRSLTALVAWLTTQEFYFKDAQTGVVERRPPSTQTIWRWHSAHKKGGFSALADRVRRDAGKSRFFSEHSAAAAFIQQKFLNEGLGNASLIYDALMRAWPSLARAGAKPPAYTTVNAFLNSIPRPLKTLAHDGPRTYFSKCSPYILRNDVPVMDFWVSDHREKDVFLQNTLFGWLPPFARITLWLTAVMDMGSRKLLGVALAPTPSSRTIGSAFCMAALNAGGIAKNFYWDNGEDFKRFERILLAPELDDAIGGLTVTRALPYRARSKPIESHFNYWSQRFDMLFRPAWRGRKPSECPEDCRAAQKQHDRFLRELQRVRDPAACKERSPFPTDRDFIAALLEFVEDWNSRPHLKLQGRTPNQVFDEAWPAAARRQVPRELLAVCFWQREERTVNPGGTVQIDKRTYEPTDDSLAALDALQGQKIIVKYDPFSLGHALAVSLTGGRILGQLRAQKLLTQSAHGKVSEDEIRAAERRRALLQRTYQGSLKTIGLAAQAMGWKRESELLIERGRARLGAACSGGLQPGSLEAAAPAARADLSPAPIASPGPAFVSDAVAEHGAIFDHIALEPPAEQEDDDAAAR